MENRNSVNVALRTKELQDALSYKFRRVWLQYTKFNDVCFTVFPIQPNSQYEMHFAKNLQDWSLENLKRIVLSKNEK